MDVILIESESERGVKARIRLISAGMGSSGYYSEEVLERDSASAFPAGTHLYFNHLTDSQRWDSDGARDVRDLVGETLSDAEYDPETKSSWADALFYHKTIDQVKQIAPAIDLSIEAKGKRDEETGEVTEIVPHPRNAVSLVDRGGRDGKIVSFEEAIALFRPDLIESARIDSSDNTPVKESQLEMKPEDISAIVDAVTTALEPRFTKIEETLKPAENNSTVADVVEALISADLTESLRKRVYESADPVAELETIQAIKESLAEGVKAEDKETFSVGRIQESSKGSDAFFSTAWRA